MSTETTLPELPHSLRGPLSEMLVGEQCRLASSLSDAAWGELPLYTVLASTEHAVRLRDEVDGDEFEMLPTTSVRYRPSQWITAGRTSLQRMPPDTVFFPLQQHLIRRDLRYVAMAVRHHEPGPSGNVLVWGRSARLLLPGGTPVVVLAKTYKSCNSCWGVGWTTDRRRVVPCHACPLGTLSLPGDAPGAETPFAGFIRVCVTDHGLFGSWQGAAFYLGDPNDPCPQRSLHLLINDAGRNFDLDALQYALTVAVGQQGMQLAEMHDLHMSVKPPRVEPPPPDGAPTRFIDI